MATNSASAGYLAPTASPVYDDSLDDIIHDLIVGLTGIAGDLVRPRWQSEPPQQPPFTTDWVAFGLSNSTVDAFAFESHDPAGEGPTSVERDELLEYIHSFYGPHAHGLAERFRDGFEIGQNRDVLRAAGLGLVEVQRANKVPALLKEKWVPKVDVTVVYRRRTSRPYPVLTIQSATGGLVTEELGTTPIIVNQ